MVLSLNLKALFCDSNKKIALDFAILFGLRIFQMVLALLTSYVLVRALSQDQYGKYHYILGWMGVFTIFALPGIQDSVMQAVARKFYGTYRLGAKLTFAFSFLGTLGLFVCACWFAYVSNDNELAKGFLTTALLFPFLHGLSTWKYYLHGQGNFKKLVKLGSINSTIMGALLVSALLLMPGNILVPLIIIMAIPAAQNILQSYKAYKVIEPDASIEEGNIKYGLKTTVYSTLSVLANHMDKILLFGFLSPLDLAFFMAAQKLTEPVQNIALDLAAVLAPRFALYNYLTKNLDKAIYYISGILGIGIIIFSFTLLPPLFIIIFGEQYSQSVPYCQALMCSLIFGNIASLRFRFIRSRMSLESVRTITLGNSIFKIISSLVLIPFFGIIGAIASVLLSRVALALQVHFDIKKFRENQTKSDNKNNDE